MFLWLKLKHIDDSMQIFEDLKEANVVVVPGELSSLPHNRLDLDAMYCKATFFMRTLHSLVS